MSFVKLFVQNRDIYNLPFLKPFFTYVLLQIQHHHERMEPVLKFSCSLQCEARTVRVTLRLILDQ